MNSGPKRKPTSIRRMNQVEIGWVAGLIEGEGNIRLNPSNQFQIRVGMSDPDIIQRLKDVTGVGNINLKKPSYANGTLRKPMYSWNVTAHNDVVHLLASIIPLMGERRRIQIESMFDSYKGVI